MGKWSPGGTRVVAQLAPPKGGRTTASTAAGTTCPLLSAAGGEKRAVPPACHVRRRPRHLGGRCRQLGASPDQGGGTEMHLNRGLSARLAIGIGVLAITTAGSATADVLTSQQTFMDGVAGVT